MNWNALHLLFFSCLLVRLNFTSSFTTKTLIPFHNKWWCSCSNALLFHSPMPFEAYFYLLLAMQSKLSPMISMTKVFNGNNMGIWTCLSSKNLNPKPFVRILNLCSKNWYSFAHTWTLIFSRSSHIFFTTQIVEIHISQGFFFCS